MRWRFDVTSVAVAAICAVLSTSAASAAVTATPAPAATPAELSAVNKLLALPWTQIAQERTEEAEADLRRALAHHFVTKEGRVAGVSWSVRTELLPAAAEIDVSRPPGFTAIAPTGFSFRAPLNGSWSFKAETNLRSTIRVGGRRWRPSIGFGLRVENLRINARANLDPGDGTRNAELKSGSIRPQFNIAGHGAIPFSIPVSLDFEFDKTLGGVAATQEVNFPLRLGVDFGASFGGQLRFALIPITLGGAVDRELAEEGISLQLVNIRFSGTASIRLPDPVGRVGLGAVVWEIAFPVPLWGDVNGMVQMLQGPQPQRWGERQRLGQTEATSGVDLAAPLSVLEAGMAEHMPYDAVLSIDRRPNGPGVPYSYDLEADSANFTGHYLAAESFRYASAPGAEALARVKSALAGLDRLFWVTQDAVLVDGRYTPVRPSLGSTFARTALPTNHGITYRKGPAARRGCTYVRPEGGWSVTRDDGSTIGTYPTYAAAALAVASQTVPTGATIRPFQNAKGTVRTWHGWGCSLGRTNEPTSRDAYAGVLMGLAYAYHLVPDSSVKQEAQRLFEQALDFLVANKWNVVTAPENKVATEFLGQFHYQLAFLRVGATMNPAKYGAMYDEAKLASVAVWLPIWFSGLDPISKYYKFNLETAVLGPLLLYETDPSLRTNYMNAYMELRRTTAHHRNAYFNLTRILVEPPATRAAVANGPSGSNAALPLKEEVKTTLAEWIARWNAVKNPNGMPTSAVADQTANVQALLWPSHAKMYYPLQGEAGYQATYALPITHRLGNLDYVWQRSPFGTAFTTARTCRPPLTAGRVKECEDRRWREGPGVDYLLAYWLGRYLSVVPPT